MATSVSIDRASLGLADLLIPSTPGGNFWLPDDGVGAPGYTHRRATATAAYVHGQLQTAAVLEQSTLPLVVYVSGNTTAAMRNNEEALIRALRQFYFVTTVTVNDYAQTWGCDCADIGEAIREPGMENARIHRREVTIPVYPIAGAF